MTYKTLLRFGAAASITGGALRVLASFIAYCPNSAGLEAIYFIIDVCLLIGLAAMYLRIAERLGVVGLACFLVAVAGLASITGPDIVFMSLDLYQVGTTVLMAGLSGLAITMLWKRVMKVVALYWIAALGVGTISAISGASFAFAVAGMLFGVGFASAGVSTLLMIDEVKANITT